MQLCFIQLVKISPLVNTSAIPQKFLIYSIIIEIAILESITNVNHPDFCLAQRMVAGMSWTTITTDNPYMNMMTATSVYQTT